MSTKLVLALLVCAISIAICEGKPTKSISDDVTSALDNLKATLDKTVKTCLDRISTTFKNYYTVMGGVMDSSLREMRKLGEKAIENLQSFKSLAEEQGVDAGECLDGIKNEISHLSIKNYGRMVSCMDVEDKKLIKVSEEGKIELIVKGRSIGKGIEGKVLNCGRDEECLMDVLGKIQLLGKEGPDELYRMMNGIIWSMKELQSKVVVCGFSAIEEFGEIVQGLQDDKSKCILDKIETINDPK